MQAFASTFGKIGIPNCISSPAEIELKSLHMYFNAVILQLDANNYYVRKTI